MHSEASASMGTMSLSSLFPKSVCSCRPFAAAAAPLELGLLPALCSSSPGAYCGWVRGCNHALSLQAQEVEDERLLDFQRLRAYHYQRFRLKTLHAIAEGVTTRLAGRQEMPAPNLGYRSGAYHKLTWVPFQISRASQPVPSQDAGKAGLWA